MSAASWLAALLLALALAPALVAQQDPELERVRNLVRAGALPRRALVEAENESLARRYRETLRRTLLSEDLEPSELKTMLDAAAGLEKIASERLDAVMTQVKAGVVPAKQLQVAKDNFSAARRQSELASTRADLIRQMIRMNATQTYREELEAAYEAPYRFFGFDDFEQELVNEIGEMYLLAFGSDPPVSAAGSTPMHRAMGLDHTGRTDVAVHPDSDEGSFLIYLLEGFGIPYIAFRSAIPGQSTGPHVHIGPPSDRLDDSELPEGEY